MKKNFSKISGKNKGKLKSLLQFASFLFTKPGLQLAKKITKRTLRKYGFIKVHPLAYSEWIKAKLDSAFLKKEFEATCGTLKLKPKIKIVILTSYPSTAAGGGQAEAVTNSLSGQSYTNWEQVPNADVCPDSGIAATTRAEYVLFMKQDSLLTPNCLFEFVKHINTHPADDIIYADEDIVDEDGKFSAPYFKPDWSPDTLLARNYIGDMVLIKETLLNQPGLSTSGQSYDDSYALLLRATELTNKIGHIPEILHHGHTRSSSATKHEAARRSIKEALDRRGNAAAVMDSGVLEAFHIRYEVKAAKKVSIIIPSKDNSELLKITLGSILQKTNYPDYEIIVLNNNSVSKEFFQLMKECAEKYPEKFRCIDALFPFNFSKLMNLGVAESKGDYILMCNNDVEVIHDDWISQMAGYVQNEKTGAVGVKLLYQDDTIQHVGIVIGLGGDAGHVFVNRGRYDAGYFNCIKTTTNYAAVTAACLMCRKEVFSEAGGMDEALEVEYNDIDFCLKLLQNGYYNVYLPFVELYHYESATRGHPFSSRASWQQHEKNLEVFKSKWQPIIDNDPFYNPNLGLEYPGFALKPQ